MRTLCVHHVETRFRCFKCEPKTVSERREEAERATREERSRLRRLAAKAKRSALTGETGGAL